MEPLGGPLAATGGNQRQSADGSSYEAALRLGGKVRRHRLSRVLQLPRSDPIRVVEQVALFKRFDGSLASWGRRFGPGTLELTSSRRRPTVAVHSTGWTSKGPWKMVTNEHPVPSAGA